MRNLCETVFQMLEHFSVRERSPRNGAGPSEPRGVGQGGRTITATKRNFQRFRSFVTKFTEVVGDERDEHIVLDRGDPFERFSVVSFVWGPGQKTPIHDHSVWGLVGVMRGAERARAFRMRDRAPHAYGE